MVVGTLARAAAALDAVFMHYSTDFVFAGTASTPYTETERPEPRSVYAQSKLIGEWLAADAPQHYVLRVESLFGGPHRRSSVDRIVDGWCAPGSRRRCSSIAWCRRASSPMSPMRPRSSCARGRRRPLSLREFRTRDVAGGRPRRSSGISASRARC